MRGYFGIGVDGISKSMNAGAILRTGHAFGADFAFFVNSNINKDKIRLSDTSKTENNIPTYVFENLNKMVLPKGCKLIGIEINNNADDLPSFRHPKLAAYVVGSERFGLSNDVMDRCDHLIKIPTKFSINLALAAGIVLYDRIVSIGKYPARPLTVGGKIIKPKTNFFGKPKIKKIKKK